MTSVNVEENDSSTCLSEFDYRQFEEFFVAPPEIILYTQRHRSTLSRAFLPSLCGYYTVRYVHATIQNPHVLDKAGSRRAQRGVTASFCVGVSWSSDFCAT